MNKTLVISLLLITSLGQQSLCKPPSLAISTADSQDSPQSFDPAKPQFCTDDFDFDCGLGELRDRCISSFWICDHIFDCTTGADEGLNCKYLHQCPAGYFMCRNGDCILANKRCDGVQDCLDRSDERACFPRSVAAGGGGVVSGAKESGGRPTEDDYHRAEAFVEFNEEARGEALSIFMLLFILCLIIGMIVVLSYCALRRYPDTKSRVDQALKDFNQTVSAIPSRLASRQSSPESRVNILVPGGDDLNENNQFFDNPLSTLQPPLALVTVSDVASTSGANNDNNNNL